MKKHRIDARNKRSNNNPETKEKRPFSMMKGVDMSDTTEMSLADVGYDITGIRLTPQRIFNMWTCAANGDPSEQVALWNHIYDMDGIVASVTNTRKAAVENKKWSIIGDNEEKRERIEKILRNTQTIISPSGDLGDLSQYGTNVVGMNFDRLKSFLLDAPFLGYAGAKIDWAMGGSEINTFIPIAPSNWRFTPTWGFYIQAPMGDIEYLDGDKREEYIMHYSTNKYGIPSVCGLVRPISMIFFRKYYALMHCSRLLEKLGIPLVTASLNPQDWNNPDSIFRAERQLKNLGSDGGGVFQKDMAIDIKGMGAADTTHFQAVIDYLDKCLAITILGQQASTQQAGGMSNGQIQENVRMDILAGDAKALEDTINDQIVRRIEENIWGTSECKFKIDYESSAEIAKIASMSDTLRKMGLEVDTDYITKNTGIPVTKKARASGNDNAIASILGGGAIATPNPVNTPAEEQAPTEQAAIPTVEPAGNTEQNPELALASLGQAALTDTIKKCKVMAFSDINEAVVVNNYLKQLINDSDIDIGLKQRITYNLPVDPVNAINYLNNRLANAIIAQESDDDVVNKLRMQIAVLSPVDIYNKVKAELPKPKPVVDNTIQENNVVPMDDMSDKNNLESIAKEINKAYSYLNWIKRGIEPDKYPKIQNKDGTYSTHKLSYASIEDGKFIVYPTIIQDEYGKLIELSGKDALEHALKTKTYIVFPNEEQAKYYSANGLIKHNAVAMADETVNDYLTPVDNGTSIAQTMKEEIKKAPDRPTPDFTVTPASSVAEAGGRLEAAKASVVELYRRINAIKPVTVESIRASLPSTKKLSQVIKTDISGAISPIPYITTDEVDTEMEKKYSEQSTSTAYNTNYKNATDAVLTLAVKHNHDEDKDVTVESVVNDYFKEFPDRKQRALAELTSVYNNYTKKIVDKRAIRLAAQTFSTNKKGNYLPTVYMELIKSDRDNLDYFNRELAYYLDKTNGEFFNSNLLAKMFRETTAKGVNSFYSVASTIAPNFFSYKGRNLNDAQQQFVYDNLDKMLTREDYNIYSNSKNAENKLYIIKKYVDNLNKVYWAKSYDTTAAKYIPSYRPVSNYFKNEDEVFKQFNKFGEKYDVFKTILNNVKFSSLFAKKTNFLDDMVLGAIGMTADLIAAGALNTIIPLGGLEYYFSLTNAGVRDELIGLGVDRDVALLAAPIVAALIAPIDYLGQKIIEKNVGWGNTKAIMSLARKKLMARLAVILKKDGIAGLQEVGTETVQGFIEEYSKLIIGEKLYGDNQTAFNNSMEQMIGAVKSIPLVVLGSGYLGRKMNKKKLQELTSDFETDISNRLDYMNNDIDAVKKVQEELADTAKPITVDSVNKLIPNTNIINPAIINTTGDTQLNEKQRVDLSTELDRRIKMVTEYVKLIESIQNEWNSGSSLLTAVNKLRVLEKTKASGKVGEALEAPIVDLLKINKTNMSEKELNMLANALDSIVILTDKESINKGVGGNRFSINGQEVAVVVDGFYSNGKIYVNEQVALSRPEETINGFVKNVVKHEATHRGLTAIDKKTSDNMMLHVWDTIPENERISLITRYAKSEAIPKIFVNIKNSSEVENNNAVKVYIAEEYVAFKAQNDETFKNTNIGKQLLFKVKAILRKAGEIKVYKDRVLSEKLRDINYTDAEIWDIIKNLRKETTIETAKDQYRSNLEDESLMSKRKYSIDENNLFDLGNIKQEFTSSKTSINSSKLPATFNKLDKMNVIKDGDIIADIGGGRFDNAIEWAKERNASLYVYDPFNRTIEHNREVLNKISNGKSDIATINNVLNVIKEKENRNKVIRQSFNVLKDNGSAYFLIYEGNGSGIGSPTQKNESYQNNKKTSEYLEEVRDVFGNATIKNDMIVANKNPLKFSISENIGTDMINNDAVSKLKKTTDFNEAGYILPDGSMLSFNRADSNTSNKIDHRIVSIDNSNIGMQQFIAQGNIRYSPETNSFQIMKEPTSAQYDTMNKIINESVKPPTIEIDSLSGNIKTGNNGKYYDFTQLLGKKYDIMDDADKAIKDIEDTFFGRKKYVSPQNQFRFSISEKSPVSEYHKAVKNWAFNNIPIIGDLVSLGYNKIYFPKDTYKDVKGYFATDKQNEGTNVVDIAKSIAIRRGVEMSDIEVNKIIDELVELSEKTYKDIVDEYKFMNASDELRYEQMAKEQGIDLDNTIVEEEKLPFDDVVNKNIIRFKIIPTENIKAINGRISELDNAKNVALRNINGNALSANGNLYSASRGNEWIKASDVEKIKIVEDDYNQSIDNEMSGLQNEPLAYDYNSAFIKVKSRLQTLIDGTNLILTEKVIDDGQGRLYTLTDKEDASQSYTISISNVFNKADYNFIYNDSIDMSEIRKYVNDIIRKTTIEVDLNELLSDDDYAKQASSLLSLLGRNKELDDIIFNKISNSLGNSIDTPREKSIRTVIGKVAKRVPLNTTILKSLANIGNAVKKTKKNTIQEMNEAEESKELAMEYIDESVPFDRPARALKKAINAIVFTNKLEYIASVNKVLEDYNELFVSSKTDSERFNNAVKYIESLFGDTGKEKDVANGLINRLRELFDSKKDGKTVYDIEVESILTAAERFETYNTSEDRTRELIDMANVELFDKDRLGKASGMEEVKSIINNAIMNAVKIIRTSNATPSAKSKFLTTIAKLANYRTTFTKEKNLDIVVEQLIDIENELNDIITAENRSSAIEQIGKTGKAIRRIGWNASTLFVDLFNDIIDAVPTNNREIAELKAGKVPYIFNTEQLKNILTVLNTLKTNKTNSMNEYVSNGEAGELTRERNENEIKLIDSAIANISNILISGNGEVNLSTADKNTLDSFNEMLLLLANEAGAQLDLFKLNDKQNAQNYASALSNEIKATALAKRHLVVRDVKEDIEGGLIFEKLVDDLNRMNAFITTKNARIDASVKKIKAKISTLDRVVDAVKIKELNDKINDIESEKSVPVVESEFIDKIKALKNKKIADMDSAELSNLSMALELAGNEYANSSGLHDARTSKTLLMLANVIKLINEYTKADIFKNGMAKLIKDSDSSNASLHIKNIDKYASKPMSKWSNKELDAFMKAVQYIAIHNKDVENKVTVNGGSGYALYNMLYYVADKVKMDNIKTSVLDKLHNIYFVPANFWGSDGATLAHVMSADPDSVAMDVFRNNPQMAEAHASGIVKRFIDGFQRYQEKNNTPVFTAKEWEGMSGYIATNNLIKSIWSKSYEFVRNLQDINKQNKEVAKALQNTKFYNVALMEKDGTVRNTRMSTGEMMYVYALQYADTIREEKNKVIRDNNEGMVIVHGNGMANDNLTGTTANKTDAVPLNIQNAESITNMLTEDEKKYVEHVVDYNSKEVSPVLAEAYEKQTGKKFKTEPLYVTIMRAAGVGRDLDVEKMSKLGGNITFGNVTLKGDNRIHEREENAKAPLIIKDFMVVNADTLRFVANYTAYIKAMGNMDRLVKSNEIQKIVKAIPGIGENLNNNIVRYYRRIIGDMNDDLQETKLFYKIMNNAMKSILAWYPKSIMAQAASLPMAYDYKGEHIGQYGINKGAIDGLGKAIGRTFLKDGTYGFKEYIPPFGSNKMNLEDILLRDLSVFAPDVYDRMTQGYINKVINNRSKDFDIIYALTNHKPSRDYLMLGQFLADRGTMAQIALDSIQQAFRENGLIVKKELEKRVDGKNIKEDDTVEKKYSIAMARAGDLARNAYETQTMTSSIYTPPVEDIGWAKAFMGQAFRSAWSRRFITLRNQALAIHNASAVGGRNEIKAYINLVSKEFRNSFYSGMYMALVAFVTGYDWEDKENEPVYTLFKDMEKLGIEKAWKKWVSQVSADTIGANLYAIPFTSGLLYTLASIMQGKDIKFTTPSIFTAQFKNLEKAQKEWKNGEYFSALLRIARPVGGLSFGVPVDRIIEYSNIGASVYNQTMRKIEKMSGNKNELINPLKSVNGEVINIENKNETNQTPVIIAQSDTVKNNNLLSLADANAIRLARILIEEKNAIQKLTQDFEQKKKEIEPYIKDEVINIPNQGSVYFVNGSASNRIDPEKVKQGLIKIARVSPEIADALIKKWSNVRDMSQYVKISDKDNITKNQGV